MRLVVIESPYAGLVDRNIAYARAAIRDCLERGEAPIASHLLFAQDGVLDDFVPEQRKLGISAGLAWAIKADLTAVYHDLGVSSGMRTGIEHASRHGRQIEFRSLPAWASEGT